jgi:splicing factor 45
MPAAVPTSADAAPPAPPAQQHGIDWYRSTADDDAAIMEERRQRNWEESQRKKAMKKFQKQFGYWNPQAPHKPERWSNLKAYRASGGYRRKLQGFNDFLRGAAGQSAMSRQGSEGHDAPQPVSASKSPAPAAQPGFAPPSSYDPTASVSIGAPVGQSEDDSDARRMPTSQHAYGAVPPPSTGFQPPPPEPARAFPPPPSVSDHVPPPPPPPPPPMAVPGPPATAYHNATISAPPVRYANATISAPPVRFERPDVRMDDGGDEPTYEEERPAKRPKISKAEAMMAKMGYVKGQGLGKNSDGVTTHLEVKIRKAPQGASTLDDYEGTKVKSQQVFDIRGGQRKKEEPGKFGQESCVVVTWGCVDGVDWTANAQRDDGGIRQDMGDVFSNKVSLVVLQCVCDARLCLWC